MNNQQQTAFKRRPSIIFNDYRQPLPATIAPLHGAKYPATVNWEISGDRDRVYFKVNDGIYGAQDQNAKLKSVEMAWCERNALFELLSSAARDKEFSASQICVYDKSFTGGDRLPLRATFTVLRGNSGEIRLHYRKSTYEAVFVMTNKHVIVNKKGENGAWTPDTKLTSALYVLAYVEALRDFLNTNEINNFKPKERKDNNNADSNNSYQNNYSQPSNTTVEVTDDFDADLNF